MKRLDSKRFVKLFFFIALAQLVVMTYIMYCVWRVDVVELRERNKAIAFSEFAFMVLVCVLGVLSYSETMQRWDKVNE